VFGLSVWLLQAEVRNGHTALVALSGGFGSLEGTVGTLSSSPGARPILVVGTRDIMASREEGTEMDYVSTFGSPDGAWVLSRVLVSFSAKQCVSFCGRLQGSVQNE